ncbi:IclR family transcriptional regulator [Ammoniphilus sp. CFH 90114]|uniref:IclR family transcriptional regulator n=1 Tax=Ammoniphilus sp. CFH 90114 TaxID=2493665 RepID=UPI00100E2D2C|nr:IclR family transcriptional regulator [Ammoniphilus sp. CFH 90114]RXT08956.1 IclR family transcriptional regulator [Ammoniphilus sp. CFH 90114]
MDNYLSSVKNACTLLKLFLNSSKEFGVTEISKKLNMSKGAVHKLLITLESEGFIRQNPKNKQYSLGYTLLELGNRVLKNHDMVDFSKPYLRQLADSTKELVCLCILDGKDAIYIDKVDSPHPVRFNVDIYRRFPLYSTSAARSILAFQSEELIEEVLSQEMKTFTPYSVKAADEMKQRLNNIRQNGYEFSSNMRNVGVTGIAAPIRDANEEVFAALSIIGPSERMEENIQKWINFVMDTAQTISNDLGSRGI